MNEIPAPILNVTAGAIATCLVALLIWSVRQVRSAAAIVADDTSIRKNVSDQAALIITQERRIQDLEKCLADANQQISDLTALVRQMQLLEEIRPAKRSAATHPAVAGESVTTT